MATAYITNFYKSYLSNYSGLSKYSWQSVYVALVVATIGSFCFFFSLYFVNVLKIDLVTSGVIVASFGLGKIVGGILAGKLSDRLKPQTVLIISFIIQALTFLIMLEIKMPLYLFITIFIIGISVYGVITSNNTAALSNCSNEDEKRKVINIIYSAFNLGTGIASIIICWLTHYNFNFIFILSSILALLSCVYLCLITSKKEFQLNKNNQTENNNVSANKKNNKILLLVLSCLFFVGLVISQLGATYTIYIANSFPSLGVRAVGFLFLLNTILIVVLQTPVVNYFAKQNKIFVMGIGGISICLSMLLLCITSYYFIAIASCVLFTFGEMLFISTAQLICYENGAEKKKGQSLGIFQSVLAGSYVVGPILGGFVYHNFGGNYLWYLCGFMGVICIILCNFCRE